MKKLAVLLITIGALLSGCVAYDDGYRERSSYRGDRDRDYRGDRDRDRDGDGVRNRQDGYPNDPRRY